MFDYTVEWLGADAENLGGLLDKSLVHSTPDQEALNAHLISVKKTAKISEVIALWMGSFGVPQSLKDSLLFQSALAVTCLMLLSPRSVSLIPNSAGQILQAFEKKGFHRILNKKKFFEMLGDARVAEDGLQFLLEKNMIELVDEFSYKLKIVPLTNICVT